MSGSSVGTPAAVFAAWCSRNLFIGKTNTTEGGLGTLTFSANGAFSYTPTSDFTGTTTFTYKANDGHADSNTVTVTISVAATSYVSNAN